MSLLLITTWFGTFLIDTDRGKIKKKKLFPKNKAKLVEKLNAIQNQEILPEEEEIVKGVKGAITVTDERLAGFGEILESILELPSGLTLTPEDFGFEQDLYREAMLELGRSRTRGSVPEDGYIVQAVKGLDDLTQISNLLSERLHEWYGLHWPELEGMVNEHEFIRLITEYGDRGTALKKETSEKFKNISESDSIGSELSVEDRSAVMDFGEQLHNVQKTRMKLENYINNRMEIFAANISALTGPLIGARLIALTGGLDRLAKVSSSTIQLLGAEKALFRHLREGGRPPKHGIIFQHPLIHNAPPWQRGKIARAFAGKIAIAAKLDMNSNKFMGDELVNDLSTRIEEIKKKYPTAPVKKRKGKTEDRSDNRDSGFKRKRRGGKGRRNRKGRGKKKHGYKN